MSKLVTLKIGAGRAGTNHLQTDQTAANFPVTLQIGEENARPTIEMTGDLPPAPELLQAYTQWQSIYRRLDWQGRPIGLSKQPQQFATLAECQAASQQLQNCLNTWLQSDSLRQVREKWLEKLQPNDPIRIVLQVSDYRLQKLPWHLWDLVERYPQAEIAFSAPMYEQPQRSTSKTSRVRILAILGNSAGIDIQTDRQLLEQLPGTQVKFLIEPQREELTHHLWQQPWDIFFFAGHSASQSDGEQGSISINPNQSLSLSELKYALRQAVAQGLKLAIFNSCDGLGLAHEFAELQIPQLIVMREPIPDRVAQSFLKHFLAAYSQNQPLYLAVRSAREQLQGIEDQFPCATWLPVIFQNPADQPQTWQELLGRTTNPTVLFPLSRSQRGLTLLLGVAISLLTLGIRHSGLLQPLELSLYDQMLRLRPQEPPDDRLLIITVTEADVKAQPQRRGSLADNSLAKLLAKLEPAQPSAIGLDIYRDFPVEKTLPKLAKQLNQSDIFIGTCRVADKVHKISEIAPPPEVIADQLGFSNFALDSDQVLRRQLLSMQPPPNAKCAADYAFSTMLALRYLAQANIAPEFQSDGRWQLGKATFYPLQSHQAGYQGIDAWGHQILLNYRNYRSPAEVAPQITLTEALSPEWDAAIVRNRVVLIGTTAESFKDVSLTPYESTSGRLAIPGVMVQAQMISQLLSAALDNRLLITTWPKWGDAIWLIAWGLASAVLSWLRRPLYVGILTVSAIVIIYIVGLSHLILIAVWIPIVPTVLIVVVASGLIHRCSPILSRSTFKLAPPKNRHKDL